MTIGLVAALPVEATDRTPPLNGGSGTQDLFIIDQYGNIVNEAANVGFFPPYSFMQTDGQIGNQERDWLAAYVAAGSPDCSRSTAAVCQGTQYQSFWTAVGRNGGWGAVQGKNVPTLTYPSAFVTAFGQQVQADSAAENWTLPEPTPICAGSVCSKTQIANMNPYILGEDIIHYATTRLVYVVFLGYAITDAYPGVACASAQCRATFGATGPPVGDVPTGATCQDGCVSPNGWENSMISLTELAKFTQAYTKQTGQVLVFGQPLLEEGLTPGFGAGSAKPTYQEAFMTAVINGVIAQTGPGSIDAFMNPGSSDAAAVGCTNANSCRAATLGIILESYIDPLNPGSFTTWFIGGSHVNSRNTIVGCENGCGWVDYNSILEFGVSPDCKSSPTCTPNGPGTRQPNTPTTTYTLFANEYQLMSQVLTNPVLAKMLCDGGICSQGDVDAVFSKQETIATDIYNGTLTTADGPAIATISDLIGAGLAYYGSDSNFSLNDAGTSTIGPGTIAAAVNAFSLPYGTKDPKPIGFQIQSPLLASNFLDWELFSGASLQTNAGQTNCNNYNGCSVVRALFTTNIGTNSLGQIASESLGAYSLVSQVELAAAKACSNGCTLKEYDDYILSYLQSQNIQLTTTSQQPQQQETSQYTSTSQSSGIVVGFQGPINQATETTPSTTLPLQTDNTMPTENVTIPLVLVQNVTQTNTNPSRPLSLLTNAVSFLSTAASGLLGAGFVFTETTQRLEEIEYSVPEIQATQAGEFFKIICKEDMENEYRNQK